DGDATIGMHAYGQQHYAGKAFHTLRKDHALCATNTHHPRGPTYHGLRVHTSYTDYLAMPIRYLPRIRRRNIAHRRTRRLRAFPSQRLLDHMMLYIDVDRTLTFDEPHTTPQWDYTRVFLVWKDE
ncbi:unnamed protein product, partial [Prorocentrum cordatum]